MQIFKELYIQGMCFRKELNSVFILLCFTLLSVNLVSVEMINVMEREK